MPFSKRNAAAVLAQCTGFSWLLSRAPSQSLLLVLNHHRIGYAESAPYDPGVFSATPDQLEAQVHFLKSCFDILSLADAIQVIEGVRRPARTQVLLTFDDGYIDNWKFAFPILQGQGVPGVFFLPTAFVGTNRLPWWDVVAGILKHAQKPAFRLTYPAPAEFDIARQGLSRVLGLVLSLYKSPATRDGERFVSMLEEACGTPRPDGSERCFLNWEEAAAMLHGGMAIGSHSHTHEILSKLSEEEQYQELLVSKRTLECHLGSEVSALAYPVGTPGSYSPATFSALARAGYRVAFSFHGGFNRPGATPRFDIRRHGVDCSSSQPRFQFRIGLAAVTGKWWF